LTVDEVQEQRGAGHLVRGGEHGPSVGLKVADGVEGGAILAEAELQWVKDVGGLEQGGQWAVDEMFESADDDGRHGDGTEGCWVGPIALALPQSHDIGFRPLLRKHAMLPGVREQGRQRPVGRVAKVPKEDGEDGVVARG
jgi:hypothetical protein